MERCQTMISVDTIWRTSSLQRLGMIVADGEYCNKTSLDEQGNVGSKRNNNALSTNCRAFVRLHLNVEFCNANLMCCFIIGSI